MATAATATDTQSVASRASSTFMTPEEQSDRRKQIREIMADTKLSQAEKNKQIQSLMDGRTSRRRSSATASVTNWSIASGSLAPRNNDDSYSNNNSLSENVVFWQAPGQPGGGGGQASYHSGLSYSSLVMPPHMNRTSRSGGDDGDDMMMDEDDEDAPDYLYDQNVDYRSVASSISDGSDHAGIGFENDYPPSTNAFLLPPGTYRQIHGRSLSLQDWGLGEQDQQRVAAHAASVIAPTLFANHPDQIGRFMEHQRPPCAHYERQCTLIAPCCGLPFGCRICHDECPVLPPPKRCTMIAIPPTTSDTSAMSSGGMGTAVAASTTDAAGGGRTTTGGGGMERRHSMPLNLDDNEFDDEQQHHKIDRFAIREVICRKCFLKQSSKTNHCKKCGTQFGEYHCSICNLWMSSKDSPYHCADCGFCRVGGRENFQHCHDCGMCIDRKLFDDHNCKAGKYYSNCPVCQEELFSSRQASHEMPCGHAIHWQCFKELTSFDTRCPVCKKTAETPEQMEPTWSAIAMGIALQPVPAELARVVNIYCNDCEERDYERRWHFLGVRCMHCRSFNTQVEQILLQGLEAASFLDRQESAAPMEGLGDATGMMDD